MLSRFKGMLEQDDDRDRPDQLHAARLRRGRRVGDPLVANPIVQSGYVASNEAIVSRRRASRADWERKLSDQGAALRAKRVRVDGGNA
jgi:hypothetical protein